MSVSPFLMPVHWGYFDRVKVESGMHWCSSPSVANNVCAEMILHKDNVGIVKPVL